MSQQNIKLLEKVDILVVGGGMSGLMAAMAAKTANNRILLVESSNVLGGQGTTGGVAGFCGDTKRVNVIFQEMVDKLSQNNFIADYSPNADRREYDLEWCAFFLQEMVHSRDIFVLLQSRITDAQAKNGRVESVRISTAGEEFVCHPKFVIDASGINIVPVRAGFPVINEGANKQLPMSLYFTMWNTGKKIKPFLPEGCPQWENDDEIPMTSLHFFPSGKVEVKMKVVGFDAADGYSLSQAEIFARRQMMGLIYFLQTKGYKGNILSTHILSSVSRAIGVREQRRIIGEHLLTFEEIKHGTVFDDGVAIGTYHTDYHWPDKMQRAGTGIVEMLEPYQIPLRSFIPKGAKNVLVPGRGASAEQMALSSFRVMATVAQMGFAAGKAAEQCIRTDKQIGEIDISELKKEIEKGGQSLDLSDYGEYLREMLFFYEDIFKEKDFQECFGPVIVQLKNNRFLTAWYAGTEKGHSDTAIWMAERYQGRWSHPRMVAKVNDQPHWNPVLFYAPDKTVHLYFKIGLSSDKWTTWGCHSRDEGKTWSDPVKFDNHSDNSPAGPVKNKILVLKDGTWLAPNSREKAGLWDAFVDISNDSGKTWVQSKHVPVNHSEFEGKGVIQPALWESEQGHVHMLLRSTCGKVCQSDSNDGGKTWSPLQKTLLPNNNSGLDIARLKDNILVVVLNPVTKSTATKNPLTVILSMDDGATWSHNLNIETADGEFCSPSIIQTEIGMAILYTANRNKIKFWHASVERIMSGYSLDRLKNEIFGGVTGI